MTKSMEFIFQPEVQAMFNSFSELFDIRIAFFSAAGDELCVGRGRPICQYCRLLRDKLSYESKCLRLDSAKRAEAANVGRLISYRCHAGLTEAITPILSNGSLIGFVMIGQFRSVEKISQSLERQWRAKYEGSELQEAFLKVPCIPPEKIESILNLFEVLVGFITSQNLIRVKNHNIFTKSRMVFQMVNQLKLNAFLNCLIVTVFDTLT